METLKALFGEWLSDLPDLDNPGLIEADNAVASDGGYRPFRPMQAISIALPATSTAGTFAFTFYPRAAIIPATYGTNLGGDNECVIASGDSGIFRRDLATASSWVEMAPSGVVSCDAFAQFDNLVIAANSDGAGVPRVATLASGATFTILATSGAAPSGARTVGIVGRFVVFGNLNSVGASRFSTLQWSAIDEPRNWPTPGSSTATATQAGEQILPYELGPISGIFGTDQYGIVLQTGGITRMQYIGGTVVFQFDILESGFGCVAPGAAIMVGGVVYFVSQNGFFSTDGVNVAPIGNAKVNKFYLDDVHPLSTSFNTFRLGCGYDRVHDVIYWSYPDKTLSDNQVADRMRNKLLLYHRASGRWSSADQNMHVIVSPSPGTRLRLSKTSGVPTDLVPDIYGFDTSRRFCRFDATAGTATFITSEQELLPGKYSYVDGVKPLVEYSSTAPAISVSIGSRNDQGDESLAFTGTTTATTDTGFADFRDSARYHRAKIQITGNFKRATGLEWRVKPEGER